MKKNNDSRRMMRERKTIKLMIELYCKDHHKKDSRSCEDCGALLDYVYLRLQRCLFADKKPACSKCPIHCYSPDMKDRIRSVMKYSGPRLIKHNPMLSLRHLFDGLKSKKMVY